MLLPALVNLPSVWCDMGSHDSFCGAGARLLCTGQPSPIQQTSSKCCARLHGAGAVISIPDHSNSTPLDAAVASQQWDMVKLLLQSGGLKVRLCCAVRSADVVVPVCTKYCPQTSTLAWVHQLRSLCFNAGQCTPSECCRQPG